MKFTTTLLVLITSATSILAAPADECLTLGGPTDLTALSPDISPSDVRKCVEHPLRLTLARKRDTILDKRSCADKQFGCTKGYCWKECTDGGNWCWLAKNQGVGDWTSCAADADCHSAVVPDSNCGIGDGNCGSCGCSGCN
ncbi:hypothetical protein BDV95DRAFT_522413 [Massariosphaeria phaeospora]|uniref:IDI-2 n=1 Tax=Massariosphaeria phaeospora TaxID=100035 RepID=A0A7C8I8D1_9PLEO|nr:hypothetical protein BDV95DRAFT_522413 [Massariosphaeria phaeospora]